MENHPGNKTFVPLFNITNSSSNVPIVGGMQIFEQPFLLTGGGPNNTTTTLMMYVYTQAFSYFNYGYAAAVGVYALVIVIIGTIIITILNRYYEKKYI